MTDLSVGAANDTKWGVVFTAKGQMTNLTLDNENGGFCSGLVLSKTLKLEGANLSLPIATSSVAAQQIIRP